MPITTTLIPPNREEDGEDDFSDKAYQFTIDLLPWTVEANALETNVNAKEASAVAAAATAINAPGTSATSTTSLAIGLGARSPTIQAGKALVPGMFVMLARTSEVSQWMFAQVTGYTGTTLDVNSLAIGQTSAGTFTDWTISLAPPELARLVGRTLVDPAIEGTIKEDIFTITDAAGFEIDPGNGSIQLLTLGANRTPLATNFVDGESVTLMIADGASYAITWSSVAVTWVTATAPTLPTTGYGVITLWKVGGVIYGAYVGAA